MGQEECHRLAHTFCRPLGYLGKGHIRLPKLLQGRRAVLSTLCQ